MQEPWADRALCRTAGKRTAPRERCVFAFPTWGCSLGLVTIASLPCLENGIGLLFTACSPARSTRLPAFLKGLKSSLGAVKRLSPSIHSSMHRRDLA